ncbi:hypothetical protein [Rhizobium sp. 1399]|jgi:hypothetical protein|uniref:hypothetical protein n=1 Tax=Rhizobium sp. 1399 TaxID=2817758 RepID=UPI0028599F12|nr:hypothetical protein [Rhizobium sp. 1399]MDR6669363.1 hypothetical protein [Rhizobium sp. 1399]
MSNLHNDSAPEFSGGGGRSTLTAFFDSRDDADRAIDRLKNLGITGVRMMRGYEADGDKAGVAGDDRSGFWSKLEDWLFPDEDRSVYAEGLRRGGFLISVEVDDATYGIAYDILDDEGSIDMDERADLWRAEGWNISRSNEAFAASKYDASQAREADDAERARQASAVQDDVFAAGAAGMAGPATPMGRHTRRLDPNSPRVRAYDLNDEAPLDQELRDDIMPTGHHRTVEESTERAERELRQAQDVDGMRQEQTLPRGR